MLRKYVGKLMQEFSFRIPTVQRALVNAANDNDELRRVLVVSGAKQAIRNYLTRNRDKAMRGSKRPKTGTDEEEFHKGERRAFWSLYCIYGGLPLMRATAADLRDSIESRSGLAESNSQRAEFEREILEKFLRRAGSDVPLSKVTTNAKVKKLAAEHSLIKTPPRNGKASERRAAH